MDTKNAYDLLRHKLQVLENETGLKAPAILDELLDKTRAESFDAGFQMAAHVEQEHTRAELATFVMAMLGKEPGDGPIDLGTLGCWYPPSGALRARRTDS